VRSVFAGSSFSSQISPTLHIGLGSAAFIDTVEVYWKSGQTELMTTFTADSLYIIRRTQTTGVPWPASIVHAVPGRPVISGIFPNPFNGQTSIQFSVEREEHVRVSMFDLLGREIRIVRNERFGAGDHSLVIAADGLASGMYVIRVSTGQTFSSSPLLLLQ
jgi:hypothetical protein